MADSLLIALVDDHPILLKGLKDVLETTPWIRVTGAYSSAEECLQGLDSGPLPDVLLMDIQMPETNGEDLTLLVRRHHRSVKIIVFSNLESSYYLQSLLEKGVSGYVIKSSGEEILLEAIQRVVAGQKYFDPVVREQALKILHEKSISANGSSMLTPRENEILLLLARDRSSQEIAEQLYVAKRTVDFHRANLLTKLGVKSSAALIKKAIDLGIIPNTQ